MEWLRHVDLSEYAPNLRGSGVHGALLVLEARWPLIMIYEECVVKLSVFWLTAPGLESGPQYNHLLTADPG